LGFGDDASAPALAPTLAPSRAVGTLLVALLCLGSLALALPPQESRGQGGHLRQRAEHADGTTTRAREWACPAAIEQTPERMSLGELDDWCVPSPSWPYRLLPQV